MNIASYPILQLLYDLADPPHTPKSLEKLQRTAGVRFPKDYCDFLLQCNGGSFHPRVEFDLPIPHGDLTKGILERFLSQDDEEGLGIEFWMDDFRDYVEEPCVPIAHCTNDDLIVLKYSIGDESFAGIWLWDRSADPRENEQILHPGADSFTKFLSMLRPVQRDADDEVETLPMFQAVELGNLSIIERYLADGGDPDIRNGLGQTLLAVAARNWWRPIIRLLLEHSADPNARDNKGMTPLHHAGGGFLDNVKLLVAAGADVNARDYNGESVLAAHYFDCKVFLRARGAKK